MAFFHCIVVMGAALGCGDSADTTESTSQHGGNDGGTPESGTTTDAGADGTRCNAPGSRSLRLLRLQGGVPRHRDRAARTERL